MEQAIQLDRSTTSWHGSANRSRSSRHNMVPCPSHCATAALLPYQGPQTLPDSGSVSLKRKRSPSRCSLHLALPADSTAAHSQVVPALEASWRWVATGAAQPGLASQWPRMLSLRCGCPAAGRHFRGFCKQLVQDLCRGEEQHKHALEQEKAVLGRTCRHLCVEPPRVPCSCCVLPPVITRQSPPLLLIPYLAR